MWECPRCHEQNEEHISYCVKCEEPRRDLEQLMNQNFVDDTREEQNPTKNNDGAYKLGIAMCIIGIILGAVLVIVGIAADNGSNYTEFTSPARFGSDFYTYIYEATQNAANNVERVNFGICDLCDILKAMTCGMGGFIMLFSLITMSRMMSRKKYENAVLRQNEALYMLLEKHLKKEPEVK